MLFLPSALETAYRIPRFSITSLKFKKRRENETEHVVFFSLPHNSASHFANDNKYFVNKEKQEGREVEKLHRVSVKEMNRLMIATCFNRAPVQQQPIQRRMATA